MVLLHARVRRDELRVRVHDFVWVFLFVVPPPPEQVFDPSILEGGLWGTRENDCLSGGQVHEYEGEDQTDLF